MTPVRVSIIGVIASLLLVLVVLELIRGRRLKERYALLWLVTGVVLLVLSAWRDALNTIAGWLGVTGYPPAVLFAVATLFILLVLLDGHLEAHRRERRPCSAGRAARRARIAPRGRACQGAAAGTGGLKTKTSPSAGSSSQFVPMPTR